MSSVCIKKLLLGLFFLFVLFSSQSKTIKKENYISRYGSISNTYYHLKNDKALTVAFLGGSITHMNGWRDLVCADLQSHFPDVKFRFINAGIPSLGSLPDVFRFKKNVLDKGNIDLLFVESAVNDQVNDTPDRIQRRALEGIIRQAISANQFMDIVLMAFVDPDKIADYRAGKVPAEVKVHQEIAKMYHLPFINLAKEVTDRIDRGEFTWEKDFLDLHPSMFGQKLYANTITTLFSDDFVKPRQLKAKKLVPPMDNLNYAYARYLNISNVDKLDKFNFINNWTPKDSVATREGFVHLPVLESFESGASFHLNFKGNVIGISVLSGPDSGTLEYSVDGKTYLPVDLYTQWSNTLYLPWFVVLADDLNSGQHELTVRASAKRNKKSTGNAIRIISFMENYLGTK